MCQQLLFLQEPLSHTDLSFPQLIATLGLCYQRLDFDEDWLHRENLVFSGLPEPESIAYTGVAPCVVNAGQWPRAALRLKMPHEHADMLDHRWSLATLLYRVYQATRAGQKHFQSLELFKGVELHVEPLSWTHGAQSIIRDRIPDSMDAQLRPDSTPHATFYADMRLGIFGYDTGSNLILWSYDTEG